MTVEHARTLHSPNQHIHTLNDRVWRLERDRCDCTKIPTSQPDDIVLQPPAPPSQDTSSMLYGRRLSDNKLVKLDRDGQFVETGLQFAGSYIASAFFLDGWTSWYHPDFWDATEPKVYLKHVEGRWPDKTLVVTDSVEWSKVQSVCVWGQTHDSLAVFGQLIPKSASGEIRITEFGPTSYVSPGCSYRHIGENTYIHYWLDGGGIRSGASLKAPTYENWSLKFVPERGLVRYTGSLEYQGSDRVRMWDGTGPFTYRGEANGVIAVSTKHLLLHNARVRVVDGVDISNTSFSGDISSAISQEELRRAGVNGTAIFEHGGSKWSILTGEKFVVLDGVQVQSSVNVQGIYPFVGYSSV